TRCTTPTPEPRRVAADPNHIAAGNEMIVEILRFAILTGCFSALYLLLSRAAVLSEGDYGRPILLIESLRHPLKAFALFGPAAPAVLAWGTLEWHRIDPDNAVRPVVVLLWAWLAWSQLRTGRNLYFRRAYLFDRATLAGLATLSAVHAA